MNRPKRFSRALRAIGVMAISFLLACQKNKLIPDTQDKSNPSTATDPSESSNSDDDVSDTSTFSLGSGGQIPPGALGRTSKGALIYIPKSYRGEAMASSVVVLWNSSYQYWQNWADQANAILIDTRSSDPQATTLCNGGRSMPSNYVDQKYLLTLIAEGRELVLKGYNVNKARIFYAGWSHGGDLAMKFASLPTATTLAPDDRQDVFCSPPPAELLELQKAAHVGQQEVAGVLAFPGHWGFHQLKAFQQTALSNLKKSCFAFVAGSNDGAYSYAYQILIPELQKVSGYRERVYGKLWSGYGHNLNQNSAALKDGMDWLFQCAPQ